MDELVSIIIPTYNRGYIIEECIDNILRQTYPKFEIILIDDGSKDDTEKKVKAYNDARISYIYQENKGACAARNAGVDFAKGGLIAFQDSDDLWQVDKLQRQVDVINETKADLVFCKKNIAGRKKKDLRCMKEGFFDKKSNSLLGISTQTILGKANVFKDNRFDVQMPRCQELELLIRLSNHYKIYCMDEILVEYREQKNSISRNMKNLIIACELILEKNKSILDDMNVTKAAIIELMGSAKACMGINDWKLFQKAYNVDRKKKIYIKMVMAYCHILDKYYKTVRK